MTETCSTCHAKTPLRKLDRAIDRIMGIEIEAMGGDNLAVVLCSHFDSDDGSEPDDNGWSDSAINAYEEIKQEIAGKFVPVREAMLAAVRQAMEAERKAVVAWIRDEAISAWGADCTGIDETGFIACAIERGEHQPKEGGHG